MNRDFLRYQTQTTPHPLGIEISHGEGSFLYDVSGRSYLDFVAGVSACSLGHCHPAVVSAIQQQSDQYLHVMVYGEFIQGPSLELCRELAQALPDPLETTYLVNSGTEAIEGAIKLARRVTGRCYHYTGAWLTTYVEAKCPYSPLASGRNIRLCRCYLL